jgi:hypothetical protein
MSSRHIIVVTVIAVKGKVALVAVIAIFIFTILIPVILVTFWIRNGVAWAFPRRWRRRRRRRGGDSRSIRCGCANTIVITSIWFAFVRQHKQKVRR